MKRLLRLLALTVVVVGARGLASPAWGATTIDPANAQNGTHFK